MKNKWQGIFPLKKWLTNNNIHLNKKLGQNFLLDINITNKIVKFSKLSHKDIVLEIGGGVGTLTISLLTTKIEKLYLVEIDKKFSIVLDKISNIDKRLKIIYADILKTPIPEDINTIVANLPYNISVPLLVNMIDKLHIQNINVLLQKEVVDRIISVSSKKKYGKISVLFQIFFNCKCVYNLPPSVFTPSPQVTSSLLRMERKNIHYIHLLPILKELLEVFNYRRKYMYKSIKYSFLLPYVKNKRCEDITPEEFLSLAKIVYKFSCKNQE
ncbi:ribosomal RNA small subunit methyltransferase A [Rickettsiales bacterium (ex Bugula neritina AB1)]|nr:ribosomal RNA small subunit methyltransferase A [Rickettsiales bacterium (ex Bugula neritina AB1)]